MSKDRKKLLHIHSSVNDKQPTPATLEVGELGVNNAKGNAFISTKNSDGEVVRFSEDETLIGWMENKEVFPYEGYVRGSNSGVTGVTEADLLQNKSNIIIKLNQVVPEDTDYSPYDEKVNGAKDIYGNLINPISESGYTDGAGIAIDMSQYAMQGANPSFSSVTTTSRTTLNGITEISGEKLDVDLSENGTTYIHSCSGITLESKNITLTDGDCGNGQMTIETNDLCLAGEDKINIYGDETNVGLDCNESNIATNTRLFGKSTLITTNENAQSYATSGNVEINASDSIVEKAANNICGEASNEATFYGAVKTNIGVNCDDEVSASTTNVRGDKIIVHAGITNLGLTAKQDVIESSERDIIITANNGICETAGDVATFYGVNLTRLGITCDGNCSTEQLEIGGTDISIHSDGDICESGNNVTIFASEGGSITIGGDSCQGNTNGTYPITYVRRPKNGTCDIHANTVDDALDEVYQRSRIYLTSTQSGDTTIYTLHQDSGSCDVKIQLPSTSGGPAPTPISSATLTIISGETTKYYSPSTAQTISIPTKVEDLDRGALNFTHNGSKVDYDPSGTTSSIDLAHSALTFDYKDASGNTISSVTYNTSAETRIGLNTLKINYKDASGDTVGTVYYDTSSAQTIDIPTSFASKTEILTILSGSTTEYYSPLSAQTISIPTKVEELNRGILSFRHNNDPFIIYDPSGTTSGITLSHADLNINYIGRNGQLVDQDIYDTSEGKGIDIPASICAIDDRGTLSFTHNGSKVDYDPCDTTSGISLAHSALTINYKDASGETISTVYYDTSSAQTIDIPTSFENLSEFNGSCYELNNDICMSGNSIVAKSFYSTSDERLKENIQPILGMDARKADLVGFRTFNFKDDETKSKTYGVIAQDVLAAGLNEIVHKDEKDNLSVDYISLLILKIDNLENKIAELSDQINELKKQNDN